MSQYLCTVHLRPGHMTPDFLSLVDCPTTPRSPSRVKANNNTMSSSPTNESHVSLSPSASQNITDIPLETLVSHLLASKRSLASISTVWRANEIVTSARTALEQSVKLSARTGFLREGISEQVKILRKVRAGVENVYNEGQKDFKVWQLCCARLHDTDGQLECD